MGLAVLVGACQVLDESPHALARRTFLHGLEMTQTILTATSLEQESLKRGGIDLSS